MKAGGQHCHRRFAAAAGRGDRLQRAQQQLGISLDRRDAVAVGQLREQLQHDLAVLEHVRDARRRADIVFEHMEAVRAGADDVDAGNMGVDAVRRLAADGGQAELRVAEHQLFGDQPGLQDFLRPVNVVEEGIQRFDPLDQPALQPGPFMRGKDAGDDVEWDQPFVRLRVAIDGKGDADAAKEEFGLRAPCLQICVRGFIEPGLERGIRLPRLRPHFVERLCLHRFARP